MSIQVKHVGNLNVAALNMEDVDFVYKEYLDVRRVYLHVTYIPPSTLYVGMHLLCHTIHFTVIMIFYICYEYFTVQSICTEEAIFAYPNLISNSSIPTKLFPKSEGMSIFLEVLS